MTQTVYVKILASDQESLFDQIEWRPWRDIDTSGDGLDSFLRLALYQWLRFSGGVLPGESLSVTIWHHLENSPRHPSGKPMCCTKTVFNVTKDEAP